MAYSATWGYVKKGSIPEAPILLKLSKEFGVSMEYLLTGQKSGSDKTPDNVINISQGRRQEDALFKKHPKLKQQLDLLVMYWLSGNPYIKVLFEAGIKLAEGLAKENPPPGKEPSTVKGNRKKAGGRPIG